MPFSMGIDRPVYPVGERMLSAFDLLRRFADDEHRENGMWRLSDLHLKVGQPAVYRFDNHLVPLEGGHPLTESMIESLVLPMLDEKQIGRLRGAQSTDVDAGYELKREGLSFRLNVFHDKDGLACAIRVLPRAIPTVERIGFVNGKLWESITEMRQGLAIVTGITGSGKSTTVASLLQHISRNRRVRIITLEDPIEYVLDSNRSLVSQREIGRHIASFDDGLRSALREDPDVLFVGEMRDQETTSLALTAAETGHFVLSTLHTRDTRGALTRIVDMFPTDRLKEIATQLSFSLSYVIAQKLVPRADGKGRRVAMEVLRNIPPVANLIRSERWHQLYAAIEGNRREGLLTLERHLSELVAAGEVTPEAARRYANDPAQIR